MNEDRWRGASPELVQSARELRRSMTPAEKILWQAIRNLNALGCRVRRQHPIGPYFADFACLSKRFVVELDGDYHDQVCAEDLSRQKHLESMGWRVIRFSNDDVLEDVEAVTRAIATQLGLVYSLCRRKPDGSGMVNSKSPTRSHYSRPLPQAGEVTLCVSRLLNAGTSHRFRSFLNNNGAMSLR